ncbi:MAG: hypothetical protein ABJA75_00290 [Bradyrhizobium sp.]
MTTNEIQLDRVRAYLAQLTAPARRHLLAEIERLQAHGEDVPGGATIIAELRAEFRATGGANYRQGNPTRYFYQPLERLLVDRAPEHANAGQISRESLTSIWEWISEIALPTMARSYTEEMKLLIATDNKRDAEKVAHAFQTKVAKSLEIALVAAGHVERVRAELARYTSSAAIFDDLQKILCGLRARDALAEFAAGLPEKIGKFEGETLAKVQERLQALTAKHAEAMPLALTLIAAHLKTPWQLMRLATKAAGSKNAADIAATPYSITIPMVLDQLDVKREALCHALRQRHVVIARGILVEIYDIEYALRVRIDELDGSEWGAQLNRLMQAVATPVEAEINSIGTPLHHILGSRALHSHNSLAGRLTYLAWKGRDAVASSVAYCRNFVN